MTPALYAHIENITKTQGYESMAEAVRQACRIMLDDEASLAGSRRYFTNQMDARFKRLEQRMADHHLQVIVYLMTAVFTIAWLVNIVLFELPSIDDEEANKVYHYWQRGMQLVELNARDLWEDMEQLTQKFIRRDHDG